MPVHNSRFFPKWKEIDAESNHSLWGTAAVAPVPRECERESEREKRPPLTRECEREGRHGGEKGQKKVRGRRKEREGELSVTNTRCRHDVALYKSFRGRGEARGRGGARGVAASRLEVAGRACQSRRRTRGPPTASA